MAIQGKDIIVVGIQAWDIEIGSNCKNIAMEFAKNNRVLYVNQPLDRISYLTKKNEAKVKKRIQIYKGQKPAVELIDTNFWTLYPKTIIESINKLPLNPAFNFINRVNTKKFAAQILKAAQKLGFKDFILFNDSSMFLGYELKEILKPAFYVYYMRDFLIKNPYWKKHGVRVEPKLIAKADLVVTNSTLYAEYGAEYNKHSYMVGQGCDTSLFNDEINTITVPEDLENIPRPRIGYVGFLSGRRLDIELLIEVAQQKPGWSIVLVGPEDDTFKASALHHLPNVFFPGSRNAEQLPGYIKGFDVAMNPQRINEATMGNYPRKIDEYLAMGKPTVASATKAMDYFSNVTYLGKTATDYIALIEKALAEDNAQLQQQRKAVGNSHSWENNVKEIYKYIQLVAKEKSIEL